MKKIKYVLIFGMLCLLVWGIYQTQKSDKEYSKTEFVLDTTCSVTFYGKDAKEAADAVFDEVRRIEKLMSMYLENSDVGRINSAKANEKVKVSPDTYKVIKTALEVSKKSDGAFDITVAPVTELWDFKGENPKIPPEEELKQALEAVGYENIVLEDENIIIKQNSDTKVDLGGSAKGYAGDCALGIAKKYDLTGGIIDLGGNIICFGQNPKSENGKWIVGIQVPFEPAGTYEKTVEIGQGAVVTSGNYQRYFELDGKLFHHIINPETGYPSEQKYDSVTVAAESSLEADCIATAAYVLGEDKGRKLIETYNGKIYYENN